MKTIIDRVSSPFRAFSEGLELTHAGSVHFSRDTAKQPVHLPLTDWLWVGRGHVEVRETVRKIESEIKGRGFHTYIIIRVSWLN